MDSDALHELKELRRNVQHKRHELGYLEDQLNTLIEAIRQRFSLVNKLLANDKSNDTSFHYVNKCKKCNDPQVLQDKMAGIVKYGCGHFVHMTCFPIVDGIRVISKTCPDIVKTDNCNQQ